MKIGDLKPSRFGELILSLPELPGVYQFFNYEGKIIYVGKAKNLKKRVSSYFIKIHENKKTEVLVRQIEDIKHIIVDSEEDALLLENNLIKKYQPRYNILLKDDKSFPWICIKNEFFPRIYYTRKIIRDGSYYYGPYTSVTMVKTILDIIYRLFQIRNCNLNLNPVTLFNHKYKVCIEYQIGNCKGPCEGYQTLESYTESINQIKDILKGNLNSVFSYLKSEMMNSASNYKFEDAEIYKIKLRLLDTYKSKSTIVSSTITNIDIFTLEEDELFGYVNYIRVIGGAIVQGQTIEIKKRLNESSEDLLIYGIAEFRQKFKNFTKEILVPFPISINLGNLKIVIPQIGEKRKLLELSQRNAIMFKLEKNKILSSKNPQNKITNLLERIKIDLRISNLPHRIECFDNSNIQGNNPVASCVVFIDCKPSKPLYRHYNIKSVIGPNDYASMEEIVQRRYSRILIEGGELPQLIVIDGGKGQVQSAKKALEILGIWGKIAVIGIAKRLEEVIFPDDEFPLFLDKRSETLMILQQIRDEAHRFGINFHRAKRSNDFLFNDLENIVGIGEKSIQVLLKKFKSIKRLSVSPENEIIELIGKSKGEKIIKYLNNSIKTD